jgi:hypothetical protein
VFTLYTDIDNHIDNYIYACDMLLINHINNYIYVCDMLLINCIDNYIYACDILLIDMPPENNLHKKK